MQPDLISQTDNGLVAAARELARRLHLPVTLVKFLVVGSIGFLIYQLCFYIFYDSPVFWFFPARDTKVDFGLFTHPDIRLLISSVLAVEIAIVFQFNSHERWTFRHRERRGWIGLRFAKFNLSSIVSPIIIVLTVNTLTPLLGLSPYISNIIGVLGGFSWNWIMNSMVIWPHARSSAGEAAAEPAGVGYRLASDAPEGQDLPTS